MHLSYNSINSSPYSSFPLLMSRYSQQIALFRFLSEHLLKYDPARRILFKGDIICG